MSDSEDSDSDSEELLDRKKDLEFFCFSKIKQIGHGGNSLIIKAHKNDLDIAIKCLTNNKNSEEIINLKILSENIYVVKYLYDFRLNLNNYISLEYLDGYITLNDYSNSKYFLKKMKKGYNLFNILCHEISDGLKSIHDLGVAHRDIKAENIMFSTKLRKIKYIDFEYSCNSETFSNKKNQNFIGGTILYVDPFLLKKTDDQFITFSDIKKNDLFSFGIIIYELIYGSTIVEAVKITDYKFVESFDYNDENKKSKDYDLVVDNYLIDFNNATNNNIDLHKLLSLNLEDRNYL